MSHIDNTFIEKISSQLDAFYSAIKAFIYYTELNKRIVKEVNNQAFWNFIEFTLLYTMLVNWNEVFGVNKKNKHWKEITLEDPIYLKKLYSAGNYNYTRWTEYRNYINELNNNFILFPDPYHHRDQNYDLEGVKVSLEVTHEWLYDLILENKDMINNQVFNKWPVDAKNYINDLKREVQAVLNEKLESAA